MIKHLLLGVLLLPLGAALPALAREGRGEHKTKVVCAKVNDLRTAGRCLARLASAMPSENDESAALISDSLESKELLAEILAAQGNQKQLRALRAAKYVGVVVQNDDEESVYYYLLANSPRSTPKLIGNVIGVVDLQYAVCPQSNGQPPEFPAKFGKVTNLLLGLNPKRTVVGTVWFEDVRCQ